MDTKFVMILAKEGMVIADMLCPACCNVRHRAGLVAFRLNTTRMECCLAEVLSEPANSKPRNDTPLKKRTLNDDHLTSVLQM